MARYSRFGAGPTIFILIFTNIVMFIFGLWWFDQLGLINSDEFFRPALELVGINTAPPISDPDDAFLLDRQRLSKWEEELNLREEALVQRENTIGEMESDISNRLESLQSREEAFEQQQNSFNDMQTTAEKINESIRQNVANLNSMSPTKAVEILVAYADEELVSHLLMAETIAEEAGATSLVSVWLSKMPPERAAEVQRKMVVAAGG